MIVTQMYHAKWVCSNVDNMVKRAIVESGLNVSVCVFFQEQLLGLLSVQYWC